MVTSNIKTTEGLIIDKIATHTVKLAPSEN